MTLDESMMERIRGDEAWVREAWATDPPAPLERTKLRIQMEADRTWLERNAPTDPSADNLDAVKHAVRAEAERLAAAARSERPRGRLRARWFIGLAAAAAVVFAVGPAFFRPGRAPGDSRDIAVGLDDWVDAVTLDALAAPDDSVDLSSVEDSLASLEVSLAEDGIAAWGGQELADLSDEIEALLTELG